MTKDNPYKRPYYGWERDKPDQRDYKFSAGVRDTVALPNKVDLRRKMPPVVSQGRIGSCTACSSIAMAEYLLKKDHKKRAFHPSILAQYYWTRQLEGNAPWDTGAQMRTSLKALNKFGAGHDKFWPYVQKRFAIRPDKRTHKDAKRHRVVEYRRLGQKLNELKSCLAQGFPFIFGFWVYESFESIELHKTGIMSRPDVEKERFLGGHAVTAVGFSDKKKAFLIRNSWSVHWGLKGHYWMPYDLVTDPTLSEDFWTAKLITMPPVRKPKPKPKRRKPRQRRRWRPKVRGRQNKRFRV